MFDETQHDLNERGETVENFLHVCWHPGFDPDILGKMEEMWGGPLPGMPCAIHEKPLRAEIMGPPPLWLRTMLNLPERREISPFWQLNAEQETVSIHWHDATHTWLPELPNGTVLASKPYPSTCQDKYSIASDTKGEWLSGKVYVHEARAGAVERRWPDLCPQIKDKSLFDWFTFGLEFDAERTVTRITAYGYRDRFLWRPTSENFHSVPREKASQ